MDSKRIIEEHGEEYYKYRLFKIAEAKVALEMLTDEERAYLFVEFCCHCGAEDSGCLCMRDE